MNNVVKHSAVWLTLITLLGLGLRLAAYWHGEAFSYFAFGDEILAYERALDYAMGVDEARYLSQARFSPDSHTPGALWTVFWLTAMRMGGGPHTVALAMILLNTGVIVITYLLGARLLGARTGLWAALFMATQPWAIYYSVGAYNPETLAFFSSLTFLALWAVVKQKYSLNSFWVGLLPLLAMQFHLSALPMFIGVMAILFLTSQRVRWSGLFLGILVGLLFYLPYFVGDGANNWANTRLMFGGESTFKFSALKAFTTPVSLLLAWCPRWTLPAFSDYMAMGNAVCGSFIIMFLFKTFGTVVMLFCLGLFFKEAHQTWRATKSSPRSAFAHAPRLFFLLTLLIVPLCVFLLSFHNFSSRYAIFLLPLLVMIPATALTHNSLSVRHKRLLTICVVINIAFNVYFSIAFFQYQGRLIASDEKFLPSFKKLALIYDMIKQDAGVQRPITVDYEAFVSAYPERNAEGIGYYVVAREKEAAMRGLTDQTLAPATYTLAVPDDSAIDVKPVWQAAGIAIIP